MDRLILPSAALAIVLSSVSIIVWQFSRVAASTLDRAAIVLALESERR